MNCVHIGHETLGEAPNGTDEASVLPISQKVGAKWNFNHGSLGFCGWALGSSHTSSRRYLRGLSFGCQRAARAGSVQTTPVVLFLRGSSSRFLDAPGFRAGWEEDSK